MPTLAQLKREAKAGTLYGEMVERYGEKEIPNGLKGIRKIVDSNSVSITFLNAFGKRSECRVSRASLVEYTEDELIIYNPGYRPLNAEEAAVMEEWNQIRGTPEFQERERIDLLSDGNSTYYQKKHFFEDSGKAYLMGSEEQKGCRFERSMGMVRDASIKGSVCLRYKIIRAAEAHVS